MKKIVLDTTVLLVSISSKSKLNWIFKSLLEGKYFLCVTTDILAEYAEIIQQQMSVLASENALGVLENLLNFIFITNHYKFNLLKDEDNNKFVDCCICANADFIVTHDSYFNILKKIDFPKVSIKNTSSFFKYIESHRFK